MTTSLNARTLRALLTLIALTCLAAAATAQLAHAAGSLMSAQNAVVRKITGTYGPATLTTRAQCRPISRSSYTCYYVATSHGLRKPMSLVGNADVTYRHNRARVKLWNGPKCSGTGCPRKLRRG